MAEPVLREPDKPAKEEKSKPNWTEQTASQVWAPDGLKQPHTAPDSDTGSDGNRDAGSDAKDDSASIKSFPTKEKQQWTVAVDLTANAERGGSAVGAKAKFEKLKELANELAGRKKGKGVTIIAQLYVPRRQGNDAECEQKPITHAPDSSSGADGQSVPPKYYIERVAIKDGKLQLLSKSPIRSKGIKQDLEDLIALTSHQYPSNKIGLILQSHGAGDMGVVRTENGDPTSLKDVDSAIRRGLSGTTHTKLDLLDFDSCLMGTMGVLNNVRGVASNLVASAENENILPGGGDGQNLNAVLLSLMRDPHQTGYAWAQHIVNNSKRGLNQENPKTVNDGCAPASVTSGTPTLAHFYLRNEKQLNDALDKLGYALAQTAENPAQRHVLQRIVSAVTRYDKDSRPDSSYEYGDLTQFLQHLKDGIRSGHISDSSGTLAHSVRAAQRATQQVVRSHWGQSNHSPCTNPPMSDETVAYQKTGGLSIYMPSVDDIIEGGRELNPASNLADETSLLSSAKSQDLKFIQHDLKYAECVHFDLSDDGPSWVLATPEKLEALNRLAPEIKAVESAKTQGELKKNIEALHNAAINLEHTPLGESLETGAREQAQMLQEYKDEVEARYQSSGWLAFIGAMAPRRRLRH